MNDVIERVRALHRQLLEDPEYEQYVTAQTEAEAVEGSLYCDTDMAAMMIRQVAVAVAARNDERPDAQSRAVSGAD